uniref:Arm DNA-binding domain-containing protein n=1 Tax=Clostridium sp. 12(A) TaxID=1163671 RepID=UPI0012DFCC15
MSVNRNSKSGTWEVRVYFKDWTGERKQATKRVLPRKVMLRTRRGPSNFKKSRDLI